MRTQISAAAVGLAVVNRPDTGHPTNPTREKTMADDAPDTGTDGTDGGDAGDDHAGDQPNEVEKWKVLARKHEDRARQNAGALKELEKLRQSTMTDQEKAVAQAKVEARIEALREVGGRLVDANVRAAAAGRNVDVDALLEGLDRTRFVGEDGEPDTKAITAWVERVAPSGQQQQPQQQWDLGQGARGAGSASDMNSLIRQKAGR